MKKMTKKEAELEKRFEEALDKEGRYVSLAKPYMHEDTAGYDDPYTEAMFYGFKLGLKTK